MLTVTIWRVLTEDFGEEPITYALCSFLSVFTIFIDILVSPFEIIGISIWFIQNHFLK